MMTQIATLAISIEEIVVLVGLTARQYNFRSARVIGKQTDGRIPVQLLHGCRKQMTIRRQNLLKASRADDRAALLTRIVWERQLELRVMAGFQLDRLRGEDLCLAIASHFPPRETLALTTGFAMGRIVAEWNAVVLEGGRLVWRPLHGGAHGGANPNPGMPRTATLYIASASHGPHPRHLYYIVHTGVYSSSPAAYACATQVCAYTARLA